MGGAPAACICIVRAGVVHRRIGETAAEANAEPEHRIPLSPHRGSLAVMQCRHATSGLSPKIPGMTLEISLSPSTFHFEKPPIIGELMA